MAPEAATATEAGTDMRPWAPRRRLRRARASGRTPRGPSPACSAALNAAHASKTALTHANPHSRVGKIAAYSKAVSRAEASLDAALAAFAINPTPANKAAVIAARKTLTQTEFTFARRAANKSVTPTVISALNGLHWYQVTARVVRGSDRAVL